MFFIANTARDGGRLPSCYGPYPSAEHAATWIDKLPPGQYVIYGPAQATQNVSVAKPEITINPAA